MGACDGVDRNGKLLRFELVTYLACPFTQVNLVYGIRNGTQLWLAELQQAAPGTSHSTSADLRCERLVQRLAS